MNTTYIPNKRTPALVAVAVAVALGLSACASAPKESPRLDAARVAVQRAAANSDGTGPSKADLDLAQSNLRQAEEALDKGKPMREVDQFAYLAEQSAMAAIARQEAVALQKRVESAESERAAVLLEARERDARLAQQQAQAAQQQAESAQMETARIQQQSAQAQQQSAAQMAAANAEMAAARAQIEALKAENTARGMVLTLGDVLFDTGSATLKPGADRQLQQVAAYLSTNQQARLIIEGHTDSVGEDSFNQRLSQQRADSVAARLASMGVSNTRIAAAGMGEAYPVTGNDTAAGRQQNRRVEIIFSDNSGAFPAGASRPAGG